MAKCPLRISLVGGSTDTEEFLSEYEAGSVISFTPNLYTYVSIHENNINRYIINYSRKESIREIEKIENDVIRLCFKHFNTPFCSITFNSNILSTGSGLASSSSFTISTIKALCLFQKIKMTNKEICDLAFNIEKEINPLAGQQDVYGCAIGNFKRIDFRKRKPQTYRFLDISFITDKHNMFLLNTHIVRNSTKILKTLNIDSSYKLLSVVNNMEKSILLKDTKSFFEIFNNGWRIKKQTSREIMNSPELLDMDKVLNSLSGVRGIKLCGAGGGGYFLVFVEKNSNDAFLNQIKQRYRKKMLIEVSIDSSGVCGVEI